jgi:hypothetical protein
VEKRMCMVKKLLKDNLQSQKNREKERKELLTSA